MHRDVTLKQLRVVTAVCAFSLSIAPVNAEDQFLVDEGKAYAEIIISAAPARSRRLSCEPTWRISLARGFQSESSLPLMLRFKIYVGERPHASKLGVNADRIERVRNQVSFQALHESHESISSDSPRTSSNRASRPSSTASSPIRSRSASLAMRCI